MTEWEEKKEGGDMVGGVLRVRTVGKPGEDREKGEKDQDRGEILYYPPSPSPTVLHCICLLAQLCNCVLAKWSEGPPQRLACR